MSILLYLTALGFGVAVHYSDHARPGGGELLDHPRAGTGLRLL